MIHESLSPMLGADETIARAELSVGVTPGTWKLQGSGWLVLFELSDCHTKTEKHHFVLGARPQSQAISIAEAWLDKYFSGPRSVLLGAVAFRNGVVIRDADPLPTLPGEIK